MKNSIPILRIFDEKKAKEFYLDFLEFKVDREHRYADDLPLYMQISFGECIIHLSEHHGDCCPGATLRIEVNNIKALHAKLLSKKYKYARPGRDEDELCVTDPFGNKITFFRES